MFSWNLLCMICFFLPQNLAKRTDDHCSQFHGMLGYPLVQCPSYDLDPNYYECYDAWKKENYYVRDTMYWCWNRLDNDETILKNLTISTAYVNDDVLFEQINQPFTSMVRNNGTHTICSSNENLASPNFDDFFYCPTSTGIPVAPFESLSSGTENPR